MVRIKSSELKNAKKLFLDGELKIFTQKNHVEMIELTNIADVNKYCYRLYKENDK